MTCQSSTSHSAVPPERRSELRLEWIVLTMGVRKEAVTAALASLPGSARCLVANGGGSEAAIAASRLIELPVNAGVPGGRDEGVRTSSADVLGFLDDDAVASPGVSERVLAAFEHDSTIGAVTFRVVDEHRRTQTLHVPRPGGRRSSESGEVALFLGGACAIRREAYEQVGGYYTDLFYGHEEVELCWRLVDAGWRIRYLADVEIFHPRTEISRHADGWRLTGRNRILIARRTLPWPIAVVHVSIWLLLGLGRARREGNAGAYWSGWRSGWRHPVDRAPIRWRGVWRLTRLGRPPIF